MSPTRYRQQHLRAGQRARGEFIAKSGSTTRSSGSGCFDPVVSFDLPLPLPVTDAEIRLVAAYLGDVINQILSEPE